MTTQDQKIFSSWFQNGRPAYFDVSVHSTTQPSHISSSASCTGVAAVAGEAAKDAKHLAMVEKVGGDLFRYVWNDFEYRHLLHCQLSTQ